MAEVSIYIPTPFRAHTGGASDVRVAAATVRDALDALVQAHPALRERIFDPDGHVWEHINVYVNEDEIRSLEGTATSVASGDELALVPAMAGGAGPETAGNSSAGGAGAAVAAGAPLLSDEQLERYSRQVLLDEVGVAGQRKLLDSRVLIVGAGGLGSPVAMYLAAAGVGTIGLLDGDVVDRSNLQRQILHGTTDVGRPKTQSAAETLAALNPDVAVVEHRVVISSENALDVLGGYDVVVNGSDNFPTRYLVNDACVMLGIPLVDASILKWEGQLAVYWPGEGCYRCLFPTPPPPGSVPSCAEGGILGAVAGQMGTLQAVETLKLLLGVGEAASGRLLLFDAFTGRFRTLKWKRNPACPVCGDEPSITALVDYEQFCGVPLPRAQVGEPAAASLVSSAEAATIAQAETIAQGAAPATPTASALGAQADTAPSDDQPFPPDSASELPVAQAATHLDDPTVAWFDVRLPHEFEHQHIPGAHLLPIDDLAERMGDVPADKTAVFVCDVGQKSALAVEILRASGYPRAYNLAGGMVAWQNRRLPLVGGAT